jgi:short-subunit dehydrogenase
MQFFHVGQERMIRIVPKVAFITGAASGIGFALAKELITTGCKVALIDNDELRLNACGKELEEHTAQYATFIADVSNHQSISSAILRALETFGSVDLFINNAGIGGTLPYTEATINHWHKIINLNIYGVIHGTNLAFHIMKEQGYGCIVNIASISGLIPFEGQSLYATTKFAVSGFTLSLRPELQKNGIELILVCPGLVKSDIFYKPIIGQSAPPDADLVPKGAMNTSAAAKTILWGIKCRKRIIIFPRKYRMMHFAYRAMPWLFTK